MEEDEKGEERKRRGVLARAAVPSRLPTQRQVAKLELRAACAITCGQPRSWLCGVAFQGRERPELRQMRQAPGRAMLPFVAQALTHVSRRRHQRSLLVKAEREGARGGRCVQGHTWPA